MLALRRGDSDGLQVAIEHGGRDLDRYALFCAYRGGDAGCMKVLINNGAQVGISLLLAATCGHADVIRSCWISMLKTATTSIMRSCRQPSPAIVTA